MLLLPFTGYTVLNLGDLCGLSEIALDVNDCRTVFPNLDFVEEQNKSNWPKGCYVLGGEYWINLNAKPKKFFNHHPSGNSNPKAAPICKAKST